MVTSAASRNHCTRAEISMPTAAMAVMPTMNRVPASVVQKVDAARPSAPNSRKK